MGFPQQEYWSQLPFPPPGDLPHPGMEHMSLMSPALADVFFTASHLWSPHTTLGLSQKAKKLSLESQKLDLNFWLRGGESQFLTSALSTSQLYFSSTP